MGLWDIFVTASMPVMNVLLLTAVGSIYATNRVGILCQDTRKHLNNVVFYIFNPALVASNLSQTFSLDSMILLWFMPINLVLNSLVGSALGWILIQITKAPKRLRAVILASCSAGNVGNLFLVLVPTMCKEKSSPLHNPGVCETYAMAYASLSMAIGTVLQWSYVYNIVRTSSSYKEDKENNYIIDVNHPDSSGRLSMKIYTSDVASTDEGMVLSCSSFEDTPVLKGYDSSMNKTKIVVSSKVNGMLQKLSRAIDTKKLFAPSTIGVVPLISTHQPSLDTACAPSEQGIALNRTCPLRADPVAKSPRRPSSLESLLFKLQFLHLSYKESALMSPKCFETAKGNDFTISE
ncbi:protein PIN-LIKES 3-like [Phalaenopsis equestris]|uniref:protein PIN-LIKES 3-like n=1 Tax=Phalaenopsis equestris TaxID=78828 RepID=UPI0009E57FE4|nr:protein PIN-LIKES 3-like [Phalaenopsis equestris]